ncbi:MAG TPA: SDR family oxidoreductase [Fulvivirga sp.]|nr:SDR family oxidoreductase [Fulvivirga sp.]
MKRKNILITGASSGLGKGMALEFAKEGCNLGLCARRVENLKELKTELLEINPNIEVFIKPLDVTQTEEVFNVFNAFNEDFIKTGQSLDRIIVNAGVGMGGSIGTGFEKGNMQTAQTNFCGALNQFEAALQIFRKQNHGHLVAISSMSALRGLKGGLTVYAATKAALASLAEGVRVDVLKTPIKVSTIFPGYIQSEMTEQKGKKAKPLPFIIDLDKGAKLLVKAINKEKSASYVPFWPWYFFKWVMPFMSLKSLRKF